MSQSTVTIDDAILAIRSAVQDFGDAETWIGRPADLDQVRWLGQLLGWEWPRSYLELIARHDGVRVRQASMPAFFDAFRLFITHRDPWHSLLYWPVARDGCGDYWVIAVHNQEDGDCPVYFLDHETNTGIGAPARVAAPSLPAFVVQYMSSTWARPPADD